MTAANNQASTAGGHTGHVDDDNDNVDDDKICRHKTE